MGKNSIKLFSIIVIFSPLFFLFSDDDINIQPLEDWITNKREITILERGGNLSVAGDIHFQYESVNEVLNGLRQRGPSSAFPNAAVDNWNVEFNLYFDYRTDNTWASVQIEYNGNCGVISGTFDNINLEMALLGGRIYNSSSFFIDLELGRRRFDYTFDSKIEFGSFMDGILLHYNKAFTNWGDFYLYGGFFIVNQAISQYGYVGEFGLLDLFNQGFFFKYSIIDWDTKDFSSPAQSSTFDFICSQFLIGWNSSLPHLNIPLTLYAAGLINTAACPLELTYYHKYNLAGYIGMTVGDLLKPGDWSFDINYQYVEPQAIPSFDAGGIGIGNAQGTGLYTTQLDGGGNELNTTTALGDVNYRGFSIEFLYLLTPNITLSQIYQQSTNAISSIGPKVDYKVFEIEIIYAF